MSELLMAGAGIWSRNPVLVGVVVAIGGLLLLVAPTFSEIVVRRRARRLPAEWSERLGEEWVAELRAIPSRMGKLAFAVGVAMISTKALLDAPDEGETTPAVVAAARAVLFVDATRVVPDTGRRVAALMVDGMISSACVAGFGGLVAPRWSSAPFAGVLLVMAWFLGVEVYFVRRFGGSPGKLLMGLRVVPVDGSLLTLRQAFLRAAPEYFLAQLGAITVAAILLVHPNAAASVSLGAAVRPPLADLLLPLWFLWPYEIAQNLWGIGSVLAYTHGDDGRTLHDFLADTIVVMQVPDAVSQPRALGPTTSTSPMR